MFKNNKSSSKEKLFPSEKEKSTEKVVSQPSRGEVTTNSGSNVPYKQLRKN